MMALMEKYAYNLESLVQERTIQLSEEKKKTENLLLRMLPRWQQWHALMPTTCLTYILLIRSVAESLIHGERVAAECFDCVSIMFSDLVGFTELCSISTPLEVVEMLNDLYSLMDSIISNFDCYKVETIGDGYMVVSGLPIRNSDHASQIASLALMVLNRASMLEIRHRPGELFQIRIGIHSGPVVAGCVGLKMPRYCLFGDTVNCASRIESTSEPRKVHISMATYGLIKKTGCYVIEERGLTFIKGKGEMRTFWLKGEDMTKRNEIAKRAKHEDWHKTPDLLCIDSISITDNDQSFFAKKNSTKSLNNIYSSALFGALAERKPPEQFPPLSFSKNFPSHDCYLCQKKKYLYQKYHHELRHKCEKFSKSNGSSSSSYSSDNGSSRNFCACSKSHCKETVAHRSPSSAPHIIFKE